MRVYQRMFSEWDVLALSLAVRSLITMKTLSPGCAHHRRASAEASLGFAVKAEMHLEVVVRATQLRDDWRRRGAARARGGRIPSQSFAGKGLKKNP